MVKVCQDLFPATDGYYMDGYEKENLDILIDSIENDFDFVILNSGQGMVRVGKSIKAMQQGCYINHEVNKKYGLNNTFTHENFVFRGDDLIKKAKEMPKYSVIVYDEAGSDLMARKTMHGTTQALLDFFRECGQLNLFVICVLPDFFDLPKGIAITRSICLVDCSFREKFNRGLFKFYGRRAKKMLYLKGRKFLDYDAHPCDFRGTFTNFYTIDEKAYRNLKYKALTGREADEKEKVSRKDKRMVAHRGELIKMLHEMGVPMTKVAERLHLDHSAVCRIASKEVSDDGCSL